jgi:hypothetical protein
VCDNLDRTLAIATQYGLDLGDHRPHSVMDLHLSALVNQRVSKKAGYSRNQLSAQIRIEPAARGTKRRTNDSVQISEAAADKRGNIQAEIGDWAMRLIKGTANEADLTIPSASLEALGLLPGWYDDWALAERERLRLRMLHGFEALSRHLTVRARHAEAIEVALLAVNAEPLRESAQRVPIEAYLVERNLA